MRQLSQGQAAFVHGKLALVSGIELPPLPAADADPVTAARMAKARQSGLDRRDRWLVDMRRDAARFGGEVDAQVLLAEAEMPQRSCA